MTKTDKNLTKNPLNTDELYFRDQLTGEIGPLAVIVGGRCFLRMISCLVYYVLASQLSEERKLQEKKKKQQQRDTTAEGPSPSKKRKTNMLAAPLRKRSREEHIKDIRQHLVETYPPCATHFKKMSPESLSRFFEDITAHCGHQMGEKEYNHTVEDYLEYKNEGQEAEERNDGKKKRYHSYIYTFPANSENIEVEAVEKKPDYLPDSICKGSKYMGTIEKEIHTGKVINVAIFHLKEEQGEVSQMNSRFMECFENSIVDTHLVKPLEESKGTLFAWSTKRLKEIADGGIELERELEKAEVEEAIEDYKKKKKAQERKQQREKKKKDKSKEDPNQTKLDQYYSPSKSSAEEEEEEEEQNVRFTSGSHQQPYPTAALAVEMEVFPPARPVEIEEKDGFFNWTSPQWDPRYTMGIFGSRGTGKSFFARWFAAQHAAYYPEVYVFTETRMNRFWEQMMNPLFIYNGFDKGKILEILLRQKKKVDAWRDGKWNGNPHVLIIFDDCVPEALYWEPIFRQIFFNGRHYFAGLIFNSQFFYRLPPSYRGNLDFVVSMAQEQERQKQGFFSEMAFSCGVTKFQAFASFTKMFDAATMDHNFILFDIRNKKLPSVQRIYTGQAEDTGIFWMGCAYYWKNNMDHLKKIKSGEARMKAEKELDYAAYGLIDPKEDLEKKRKREDDHKKSRKDRKLNKPLCFHEERDDDFGVSSDLRGGVDKYPLPEPFKEEDKEKPKVDFMTSYNAMLLKYGGRV